MARIYLQLQVDFDDDDKVARLNRYGRDARGIRDLLVAMWRYCKREKSDGHVPLEMVGKLAYPDTEKNGIRDADRLVEVGLAVHTETGYYLGGFLKHNKSREQIEAAAAQKAEAGRAGGKASGQVRKDKAEAKQPASPGRSHSSENREHSSQSKVQAGVLQGENRQVTLRAVDATEPTPINPSDARCTAHRGVADPGPCRGCRRERERLERLVAAEAERLAREIEEAARACTDCDGVHVIDSNGAPTRAKCSHPRTRRTA